jgi:hypothetical protein
VLIGLSIVPILQQLDVTIFAHSDTCSEVFCILLDGVSPEL